MIVFDKIHISPSTNLPLLIACNPDFTISLINAQTANQRKTWLNYKIERF